MLKADGWYEIACDGDHHQFKHPTKKGKSNCHTSKKRYTYWNFKRYKQTSGCYISVKEEEKHEKRPICLCGNLFL